MPKIHILSGLLEGKVYDLKDERVTVGRALDNMIRLDDGTVSHHHALFLADGQDYYKLRDMNSTNGSRVNGMRIVESRLNHGDQVRIGSVEMRYEDQKRISQPLPPMQSGVNVKDVSTHVMPPSTFSSSSPFGRKQKTDSKIWLWAVIGLGVLAVIAVIIVLIKLNHL